MDQWDDMRVFLAVARGESLSRAAPKLRMDVATVGRRIARLEDRTGAALFTKSPQGYALTERGARMLAHAEAAETALARAAEEARGGDKAQMRGQIRIGAPDGAANYLLPQVCERIGAANPDLDIQILAQPRVVNLSRREADMAITVSPPQAGRLLVQKITDYRLHLAARADIADQITDRSTLNDARIVGYIPDMIFDKELDYLGELGVERVALASNSVAVQTMALRSGAGGGIVHDFALPFAPELRRVLENKVSLTRAFYLVRHQSDARSEFQIRFAEALISEVRAEVARLELGVT